MPNTFELIASSTVGSGGAANIDFTSIPATFTDLCLKVSIRGTTNIGAQVMFVQYNNDSTQSNYSRIRLLGDGSSASSNASSDSEAAITQGANATANTFSNMEVYIPNYRGSSKKSSSIDFVNETNATTEYMALYAHIWNNTSAITSVKLIPNGGTFVQYSTAYLYGVKNA